MAWLTWKKMLLGCGLIVLLVGFVVAAWLSTAALGVWPRHREAHAKGLPAPADADPEDEEEHIPVRTIHPKSDPSFVISIERPAYVEAYFKADLQARVAGPVKFIQKDVGDKVQRGELLAVIDVPDLLQEVAQKEAIVEQRREEVRLAEAKVKIAEAAAEVAYANIDQKKAEVIQADATRDFREKRWKRYQVLFKRGAIDALLVDEEERDFHVGEAACSSATAAVKKAEADWKESKANVEAAEADVKLKKSLVEVARKDRDRMRALADYANIRAPFDGVIVERIDPGSFVQNATTGHSEPIVTVARTDIVTVVMKVPDNFAPYVTRATEASIRMGKLVINGKVTRFVPVIQDKDRTMRVEVDLYNGTSEEYRRLLIHRAAAAVAPLGKPNVLDAATMQFASRCACRQDLKGVNDPFPLLLQTTPEPGQAEQRLRAGMVGDMRLLLRHFEDAHLLPSGAVFSRGGKQYIMQVHDGTAQLVPVRVQVDDGSLVKVVVIAHAADPKLGQQEVLQELIGDEEIVASRQSEISQGQAVKTNLEDW